MIEPKQLYLLKSRNDVELLLSNFSEKLKEVSLYEFIVDSFWECIQGQKKTLNKFNWQSEEFVENSPEWLKWTNETVNILSSSAAYAEEIWKTLELWFQRGRETDKRLELLSRKSGQTIGVALGPRFAVFDYVKIDKPQDFIDPQRQACFIETLQHERIHVFCRYWNVLKYDIPFATSLGLLAAQIKKWGQVYYKKWGQVYY